MLIQKQDYILDIDIEETRDYYKNNSLCECTDCKNFYLQAQDKFPLLTKFLDDLGVYISRPDELSANNINNEIDYNFISYTIAGKIIQSDKYEIDMMDGGMFLNIVINNSYIPNEQRTDEYFTVTVYGVRLPYILQEPYSGSFKKKNIIERIKRIFKKNEKKIVTSDMPPLHKIVEMMYDKYLDAFSDEVIRVVYSKDKTMRYVILKDEKGLFKYCLEAIYQFDEEEWKYIFSDKECLPAMWEPYCGKYRNSIFATENDAMKELKEEPEYKLYFI